MALTIRRDLVPLLLFLAWLTGAGYVLSQGYTPPASGGSGAPTDAEYVVGASNGSLSAERVGTDTETHDWDFGTSGQALIKSIAGPRPSDSRWFYCHPKTGTVSCVGVSHYQEGTWTNGTPDSVDGLYIDGATAASTGNVMLVGTGDLTAYGASDWYYEVKIRLEQTTNQRIALGYASCASSTAATASADPTCHLAWLRADTSASDTTWQSVTNDNSGGGTVSDTGVTIDTNAVVFRIKRTGSNVYFYSGSSSTPVTTHTTNLPGAGAMWVYNVVRTLADEAKSVRISYFYGEVQ